MKRNLSANSGPRVSLGGNPLLRSLFWQALLLLAIAGLFVWAGANVIANLRASNISTGFGFLADQANFDITWSYIPFQAGQSYARALLAGFGNTLLAALAGIVLATVLGFIVGVARLSRNLLVAKAATVWVEVLRNTPLLLQLLVWYNVVLKPLPGPRQSISFAGGFLLNNRGLSGPMPVAGPGWTGFGLGLIAALLLSVALVRLSRRRRRATGTGLPSALIVPVLLLVLPLLAAVLAAGGVRDALPAIWPELRGFNVVGGMVIPPELVALVLGLGLYTSAFIAEIVRAGVLAVSKGQSEAARALGLPDSLAMRLIIIPQALRMIIPPLSGQYLNLTKNSSLAVAIGYPELVLIGAGPVLQNSGQALEVISLIMLIYLGISLFTSLLMNWWNARMQLVER